MCRQHWIIILICILNFYLVQDNNLFAQIETKEPTWDTIYITPDSVIVFMDSVLIPLSDPIILIEEGTHYKIRKNHYKLKLVRSKNSFHIHLNNVVGQAN